MKRKILVASSMVVLVVMMINCASTDVTSETGYKLKLDTKSERLGVVPVLCNNERAVIIGNTINSVEDARKSALLIPAYNYVFSENSPDGIRYFNATVQVFQRPDGTLSFSFLGDGEKVYISEDKILPMSVAEEQRKVVLFLFGGTTGRGNISSQNQIKREELAIGEELRQASLFYWKEKYPRIHQIILERLPYWKGFSPTIQVWLAKLAAEGNMEGYEELLAAAEKIKAEPKKTIDPVTTYRGVEAVDYIVIAAERLLKQGRITPTAFELIIHYTQLEHGQTVYWYMSKRQLTAEEFCLGVGSGKINEIELRF